MDTSKTIMTIKETAREYSFPEHGLRGLVKRGELPVIRCGNRSYITRAVFEEFLMKGGTTHEPKA